MCDWGDEVDVRVPIPAEASYTGKFRWAVKKIDRCLEPYIRALNAAGLFTGGSCCGHGKENGMIGFHDGTRFTIDKVSLYKRLCVHPSDDEPRATPIRSLPEESELGNMKSEKKLEVRRK